jgi:hypothetical protein
MEAMDAVPDVAQLMTRVLNLEQQLGSVQQQLNTAQHQNVNLHQQNQALQGAVNLAMAAAASQPSGSGSSQRLKPVKPKNYSGRGDLDAWLFSVRNYCHASSAESEPAVVAFAGTLLDGAALDWWRMFHESRPLDVPQTLDAFEVAIRDRFARTTSRLFKHKQHGALREYVQSFQRLAVKCKTMAPLTTVQLFLNGLKDDIHTEVYRQDPKTLEEAIRLAERYDNREHMRRDQGSRGGGGPTPMEVDNVSGHRGGRGNRERRFDRRDERRFDRRFDRRPDRRNGGGGRDGNGGGGRDGNGGGGRDERACWNCGKTGHIARDCRARAGRDKPKGKPKPRVNAAVGSESGTESEN